MMKTGSKWVWLACAAAAMTETASVVRAEDSLPETIRPYFAPPEEWAGKKGDFRSPLVFEDGRKVTTPGEWAERRRELLEIWEGHMGKWPELITGQEAILSDAVEHDDHTRHRIRFRWLPEEETSGYLLIPKGEGPFPAVLTVFYEPETAVGEGKPDRDFALQLAKRGFVTLSIGTTDASQAREYSLYWPSLQDAKVQPLSMLAYAAANAWHVLADRPEVDAERIGVTGHSFGGKWAMFASCLFDKFACAAWSDPGIVFDVRPSVNYWEPWYLGYHPKPWRKRGVPDEANPARGLYPKLLEEGRDLHELHVLMAPRPFLVSAGSEDPPHRWEALHHSLEVYQLLGHENRVAMHNRPEHSPNTESSEIMYQFFEHFLKP